MKQSSHCRLVDMFDEKEFGVCEILLDLHNLMGRPVAKNDDGNDAAVAATPEFLDWGTKKRRSNIAAHHYHDVAASPSPPPLPTKEEFHSEVKVEEERPVQDKVEASSPATPLTFPASESDDKPENHSIRKSSKKRTKEEWLEIIQGLTESREVLIGEVERVRSYYKQLQGFNLVLKATEQKIKEEQALKKNKSLNPCGKNIRQHSRVSLVPPVEQQGVIDPMLLESKTREEEYQHHHPHYQYLQQYGQLVSSAAANYKTTGPRVNAFDLNVSAEDDFGLEPLDHAMMTREDSKEKRRQRKLIISNKKGRC